jgi:protein involved in polysaccharide export with SLBB domain
MKKYFLLLLFVANVLVLSAQNLLSGKDLTNFKADALTEAEVAQIQAQLKQSGLTIEQVEQQAIAKGASPSEIAKLKSRLNSAGTGKTATNKAPLQKMQASRNSFADTTTAKPKIKSNINPLIFGSELFSGDQSQGFSYNQNLATPMNYEIGPGDVLKLVVYGVQEYTTEVSVSKEGAIQVDNVGQIKVAGLTIEAAFEKVKLQMARTAYSSIARGESKLSLTLSDIRTIQITLIGAARSGNYNVSSFSTILSAIAEAGGPNEIGSYRNIELIRNNKVFKTIDLYQFIQKGDQSQNIGLKDRDVIRIPAYKSRMEIRGQVKRAGIFEIAGNENFAQFLQYAGGFDDTAYTALVKIIQNNDRERVVKDLPESEFKSYQPKGGDIITVSKIIDRFQNRVKLGGAVYRPDVYQLTPGMRISDLVQKADGVKEDAFLGRAQLIRLKPNLLKELVSINLAKALQGDPSENLILKREDELFVNSVLDLRDSLSVQILGEVRSPGRYVYVDSMTVKDLILMTGGFTHAADKNIEVARMKYYNEKVDDNKVTTVYRTEINGDLSFSKGNENIVLQPFDVITITRKTGYALPEIVTVSGQVQNVGKYTLRTRVERVSDVVNRAGGLILDAYGEGAYIKRSRNVIDTLKSDETKESIEKTYARKFKAQQEADIATNNNALMVAGGTSAMSGSLTSNAALKTNKQFRDTLDQIFREMDNDFYQVAIDINYIMKHPGSEEDLILKDKDEVVIPKVDNKVKISGGVLRPTNIVFKEGLTIGECISSAGGISEYARRGRAYVVYANGKSQRTRHFGIFRINPKIKPGCEVVLPETNEKKEKPISTAATMIATIAQVIAALATVKLLTK